MKRTIITTILTLALTAFAIQAVGQTAFSGAGMIESTTGGFKFPDGSIQVSATSLPPTAVAHVLIKNGLDIELTGRGSFDPNNETLNYVWDFGDGFGTDTGEVGTYSYSEPGIYVALLTVTNSSGLLAEESIKLEIEDLNLPPSATGNTDTLEFEFTCGVIVQLSGSASVDPEGDALTYKWGFHALPIGSTAQMNNDSVINPSFTIDIPGDYFITLTVNDGHLDSSVDHFDISCT